MDFASPYQCGIHQPPPPSPRYLLEGAGGVFTGSRYKDLQIQTLGLWGEIRDWREGSTIVQKTHDADGKHVMEASIPHSLCIHSGASA